MGTNYYARFNACGCCGRDDRLHIGKDSAGWRFALRGFREHDLDQEWTEELFRKAGLTECRSWDDWQKLLALADGVQDEYGRDVALDKLRKIVNERGDGLLARETRQDGSATAGPQDETWDLMFVEFF